ncbi:fructosamine kinase family protein [Maribacter thermophilus]|uniref:fructosamine kinase family protein n=1 Tax=Maribacter thermophilus TaxID=1197874 RepID=UPI00069950C4|nr:fructosamine kinase family protein [Maribacter thermophilus]
MDKELLEHISTLLGVVLKKVAPLSGGDVSEVYLLETVTDRFVCKVNTLDNTPLLHAEKIGLEVIAASKTIAVPKTYDCDQIGEKAFLLMEFIQSRTPTTSYMAILGRQLAALHKSCGVKIFGGENDNYIGSLPQSNSTHNEWASFYAHERLIPQLKTAVDNGHLPYKQIPSQEWLLKRCEQLFPNVTPALLHGDLWSGNYLISDDGIPYLIDPAVYYGHNEVDLAMTKLFGGFSNSFYDAYNEYFPLENGWKERQDIYQLYYLLVHLNMFGPSYKPSVLHILSAYFT